MNEKEQLEKIKENIFNLHMSLIDAPYHGVSNEQVKAIEFSINKVLKGTEITTKQLRKEGFKR